jgi:hypothetical protein
MNVKDMRLSDIEELTLGVEHLAIQLDRINQDTPGSEKIVFRLEKASEMFAHSIKYGLNKLESALLDLDYTKIQQDLAGVVQHQVGGIIHSMEKVVDHTRSLELAHRKTDKSLVKTEALIDQIDMRISELTYQVRQIPILERNLRIASAGGGFIMGVFALYLLSYLIWLPQPYFATPEQKTLVGMVKDQTLHIDTNSADTLKVRVNYDTNNNINN